MDDLYNNAWGDPSKPAEDITETVLGARSTWTSPKATTRVEDDEADLAAPSWSTGAGISWDEPSDDTHGFGWSQSESDMAWGASTYEVIHIAKPIEVTPEEVEVEVKEELPVAPPSPPSPKEDKHLLPSPQRVGEEQFSHIMKAIIPTANAQQRREILKHLELTPDQKKRVQDYMRNRR